uniref:LRAT domain-containing protein n=1 Tax=Lates calcarifer TaxID=8187 RepID=A0A4W6EXP0_LATCA
PPEPGDLIEIFCVGYQHWAVYVGDRDTVHLVNPPEPFFYNAALGQKKEKLIDVVGNNKWQINNILDTEYKSRPAQRIVKNALLFVAKDVNYTMSSWNCEHFASEQRYVIKSLNIKVWIVYQMGQLAPSTIHWIYESALFLVIIVLSEITFL